MIKRGASFYSFQEEFYLHRMTYQGARWVEDAFEVDSIEQVRRHQVMLKRLLGEA